MNVLVNRMLAISGGLFLAAGALANPNPIRFTISQVPEQYVELDVLQKPLAEVLEVIAKTAKITLHYDGLPKNTVTASCKGPTTKLILQCLLDKQADLIFRYGKVAVSSQQNVLEEVWIHGTIDLTGQEKENNKAVTVTPSDKKSDNSRLQNKLGEAAISQWLDLAQGDDPERRASAIATLALQTDTQQPRVRNVLLSALSDPSAEVRAQAVFALAQDKGADAAAGLALALLDKDVSVRLMVVDSADNHPDLIQQALEDRDETVRLYAATKLEALAMP